jgi:hypothetical protein
MNKQSIVQEVSDPKTVQMQARYYLGKNARVYLSDNKNKKYMILNPNTNTFVDFGDIKYKDYTKTLDANKRAQFKRRNDK